MFRKMSPMQLVYLIPYLAMVVGLYVLHSAWIPFAIYHGLIVVSLVTTGRGISCHELTRGWDWRQGLGAVVFGIGGGIVLFLLAPLAGIDHKLLTPALAKLGLEGNSWLLFVFYHALINPWFEEAFWRGQLGSESRRVIGADVVFAAYHLLVLALFLDPVWLVLSFVLLTFAGWLWRQMARRQRGLLMPVVSHLCADASIMTAVFVLNRSVDITQ